MRPTSARYRGLVRSLTQCLMYALATLLIRSTDGSGGGSCCCCCCTALAAMHRLHRACCCSGSGNRSSRCCRGGMGCGCCSLGHRQALATAAGEWRRRGAAATDGAGAAALAMPPLLERPLQAGRSSPTTCARQCTAALHGGAHGSVHGNTQGSMRGAVLTRPPTATAKPRAHMRHQLGLWLRPSGENWWQRGACQVRWQAEVVADTADDRRWGLPHSIRLCGGGRVLRLENMDNGAMRNACAMGSEPHA
eukprot:362959-Chlamydomonas_euryale.AAC.3